MTIKRPRAIATLLLAWLCFGATLANSEEINTGDSLDIAVFEWDREAGAIRSWETINNEYTVAEDGILYFPFIDGGIVAVGLDTNELASSLSSRLLESLSLPDLPAVQIKQSSTEPVSVYGFVRNTGRFDIRPGQTIREIFVAAGGSPIALNANPGLELSELTQRLDVLQSRRTILSARLARLRAEGEGAATLDLPEDVDPEVAEKQKREEKVFSLNRERTERQTQLLEGRIGLLTGEIGSLQTQLKNLSLQLELAQEQLDNINQLADRGLAVNARQLDALSLVSNLETRQLTLQLAVTEARQNLSVAELDLVDAQSGASASRLVAAQDVENQLLLLEDQ
ncbi:polysaccharide biosynthesis/export family protein, partial [Cognatishimia activa]